MIKFALDSIVPMCLVPDYLEMSLFHGLERSSFFGFTLF